MRESWSAAAIAAAMVLAPGAGAQTPSAGKPAAAAKRAEFPNRPVRFVVGLAPGGATDIIGRLVAKYLAEELGQPVIVDNRAGAAGSIAGGIVAKATPDGYTMLLVSSSFAINPSLHDLPFDPVRDFSPVAQIGQAPFLLVVNPSLPVQNAKELIALARAKPKSIKYSSSGIGGSGHMAGLLFGRMAGVDIEHVGYRGGSPALIAVMSGEVQFMLSAIVAGLQQWRAGKVRVLGVSSVKRSRAAPDVPTVAEAGVPGYQVMTWYGVLAPAGVPREVIATVNAGIRKAAFLPEVTERLLADGAEPVSDTPAAFAKHLEAEINRFGKLARDAGLKEKSASR